MKKILFAVTALVAVGSMAAAEVSLSGYGRFGLDYNDANDDGVDSNGNLTGNGVSSTTITSRLRLQIDMTAETDSGIGFSARYRVEAESRDNNPGDADANGGNFNVSYGGFTLSVGNVNGALESTPGLYLETRTAGTGIDGAGFVSHVGNVNGGGFDWDSYSSTGAGRNVLAARFSNSTFTGMVSRSESNVLPPASRSTLKAGETRNERLAGMLSYKLGGWTVAASAQDSTALWEDKTIVTVSGDLGNFGVRAAYADNDGIDKYGLYGRVNVGAASKVVLWATSEDAVSAADVARGRANNRDGVAGSNNSEGESYGIHYSYDLGAGASFEAGYRRASNDNNTFQAGIYFAF